MNPCVSGFTVDFVTQTCMFLCRTPAVCGRMHTHEDIFYMQACSVQETAFKHVMAPRPPYRGFHTWLDNVN